MLQLLLTLEERHEYGLVVEMRHHNLLNKLFEELLQVQ